MATGRSDSPNQVNKVFGFHFIFGEPLVVRTTAIEVEVKVSAVRPLPS